MLGHLRVFRSAGALVLCLLATAISASYAAPGIAGATRLAAKDGVVGVAKDNAAVQEVARRFDDAPYGVDPVVTGPVSAAFKEARKDARCDSAVWPDIPGVCYPK